MDMKPAECMEDLEIKGRAEPFSWTKKKKKNAHSVVIYLYLSDFLLKISPLQS